MAAHLGASASAGVAGEEAFWTACPHCCYAHSFPRLYLGRRLRCPTPACRRAFPAAELPAAPPIVPGTDMYFCAWAFFPLGPPVTADSWVPFTPFHPFNAPPSPSPAPNPAAASADSPSRAGPTSRMKMGVCFKGRARAEAEEEEEKAAAVIDLEVKVEEGVLGEQWDSGIAVNEAVDLSELGFRVEEEVEKAAAVIDLEVEVEVEEGVLGEQWDSGIAVNEAVDLSELGFRVDEMGVLHDLP